MGVCPAERELARRDRRGPGKEMEQVSASSLTGMEAGYRVRLTTYIDDAITEVVHTLSRRSPLRRMVVIFLFLGSFRTVLVPIVSIPVSLIGVAS